MAMAWAVPHHWANSCSKAEVSWPVQVLTLPEASTRVAASPTVEQWGPEAAVAVYCDILKFLSPLRDETTSIPGEVVTDAEEAFAALNEEMWDKLQLGIKGFFGSPETLERFIDITSDTFDIPYHPSRA